MEQDNHDFHLNLYRQGDGNPARSVLITNRAEVKKCKDKPRVDVVSAGKGKCRRKLLLSNVSDEDSPHCLLNLL